MKKLVLSLALVVSGIFVLNFGSTKAATENILSEDFGNSPEDVQTFEEKSLEDSYQDAINGVTDLPVELDNASNVVKLNNFSISSTNSLSSTDDIEVKEYKTAQILEKSDTDQLIAVTTFNDAYVSAADSTIQAASTLSDGDKGVSKSDSTLGVKASSRIYYHSKVTSGINYVTIYKVTGGWTISDSTIKLSNRKVVFGQSGYPAVSKSMTKYPTTNSFYYSVSGWPYVNMNAGHQV